MCATKSKPALELAHIFEKYQNILPYADDRQWEVINAITACRTEKLGGEVLKCDKCGYTEIRYRSCRDRHCPKCQSLKQAGWVLRRNEDLLPVPYFHLVFTIPHELLELFRMNQSVCYTVLFWASNRTLKEAAGNEKNLGAEKIGFFSILHTWDQKLNYHPHIHCVVPGGGLSDGKWVQSKESFFIHVKKLSLIFRGICLKYLEELYDDGKITIPLNPSSSLPARDRFKSILKASSRKYWNVYAKPPFKGPFWVLRYLSRYTHKIAISNHRLVSMTDGKVSFTWNDRDNGHKKKICTLAAMEFMRRFLLHVLPKGFVRIRYYGFMANVCRKDSIELIRSLLDCEAPKTEPVPDSMGELFRLVTGKDPDSCKACGHSPVVSIKTLPDKCKVREAG